MNTTAVAEVPTPSREEFAALLEETLGEKPRIEGTVVKGRVVAVEGDEVVIDVGLKSEGRVPVKEFTRPGEPGVPKPGDVVEVYVERYENRSGEVVLSRDRARREECWNRLEEAYKKGEPVTGRIFGKVKGGYAVDLGGAVAFLPGSQVDIRPVRDIGPLLDKPEPFLILKMDRRRGNIVVSRRAVLEESRAEQRKELLAKLHEGQVLEGVVKNITDYGAFVDLGGVDGLLHVTDIAWRRIAHPADVLQIGQTVRVKVIRYNPETGRISLGMKQLQPDPWEGVALKYPVGAKFRGRVTNITDYGAFVELEPGVEGLIHVSEMSWTKKNVHPSKILSIGQEVEVMILDVDEERRRISLGLKQCLPNPWEEFLEKHPKGSVVEGEVRNITEFGLFVGLEGEIDGLVHINDLSWTEPPEEAIKKYKVGDIVRAVVLDVDVDNQRIALGIKQLEEDPFKKAIAGIQKGSRVTCVVKAVTPQGLEVETVSGAPGFIRRSELARERSEQRPDRFAVGERLDALVTGIDEANRRLLLSIRQLEIEEEKQAMRAFGSPDSGATLGEILGEALRQKQKELEAQQKGEAGEAAQQEVSAAPEDGEGEKREEG